MREDNQRRILEGLTHINEASEKYILVDDIPHTSQLRRFFIANPNLIDDFYDFMRKWEKVRDDYYEKNLKNLEVKPLKFTIGRRFIKIVANGAVTAFVDGYGNVYKPASWSKPADGVRYYLDEFDKINFDAYGSFLYGNRNLKPRGEEDF